MVQRIETGQKREALLTRKGNRFTAIHALQPVIHKRLVNRQHGAKRSTRFLNVRFTDLDVPAKAGQPCGHCGRALQWEYDCATGQGQLNCTPGCALSARAFAPPVSRGTLPAPHEATAPPPASRGAYGLSRGPPMGHVQEATNSWLYVPLLQAAAADLAPPAVEAWCADPRAADWWEPARRLLMLSSPVAPQVLAEAVRHATEAAPPHVRHLPDLLQRLEHAGLPNSALVHVGWAVRQLCEPDGYLIATVQKALLQCYGGQAFALEVDRHSDRFRQRPRSPLPDPAGGLTGAADAPGSAEALSRHDCERENASAAPAPPSHPTLEEDRAAADSDGTEGAAAAPATPCHYLCYPHA